ncbi:MAG: hypothetical protein LC660_18585 [Desulfobacteraceae bacterium]|nr:hypothetical protein [Desulfobacteraceae bacterium]
MMLTAWGRTVFQFYLNNKISYRENGNISGAPWLFDEPVNTRDFMALLWYGRLWRKAVHTKNVSTHLWKIC